MKPLICDMCGSGDVVKVDDLFICQSCGTKYSIEAAKKMMISGQVEVVNVVNTVNHDFKSKLALADIKAKLYFEKGPMAVNGAGLSEDQENLKGYDAVIAFYDHALKEGYDQSIGWAKLARFYLNANFQGFQNKTRGVFDNKSFTDQYDFYMNNAINYAPSLEEKNAYKEEKAVGLSHIERELLNAPRLNATTEAAKSIGKGIGTILLKIFGYILLLAIITLILNYFFPLV